MGGETIWRRFRRKATARGRMLPQPAPKPGTKEVEALAAALNHSAERAQTLWFSFLTFMVYLAIATGTTTHRMLFLEEPLNLPVLNIKLPLLGFYILTPIIFIVWKSFGDKTREWEMEAVVKLSKAEGDETAILFEFGRKARV